MLIDGIGATAFAGCLLGCAYIAVIRAGEVAVETRELTTTLNNASDDLATARAACERQRAILEQRKSEAASERQLPNKLPLEEYFQRISSLAESNQVRVLRQNPLPGRRYPGLLEQRSAFEVSSTMPDLARFFKAVETDESWADIAYLKIAGSEGHAADAVEGERVTTMTFSLFSADKSEPADSKAKPTP